MESLHASWDTSGFFSLMGQIARPWAIFSWEDSVRVGGQSPFSTHAVRLAHRIHGNWELKLTSDWVETPESPCILLYYVNCLYRHNIPSPYYLSMVMPCHLLPMSEELLALLRFLVADTYMQPLVRLKFSFQPYYIPIHDGTEDLRWASAWIKCPWIAAKTLQELSIAGDLAVWYQYKDYVCLYIIRIPS